MYMSVKCSIETKSPMYCLYEALPIMVQYGQGTVKYCKQNATN